MEFDVFISHKITDGNQWPMAKQVKDLLEAKGYRVFFSSDQLQHAESLTESIEIALGQSRLGVAFISHDYMASKGYAYMEFGAMKKMFLENKLGLVPFLLDVSYDDFVHRYNNRLLGDIVLFSQKNPEEMVKIIEKRLNGDENPSPPPSPPTPPPPPSSNIEVAIPFKKIAYIAGGIIALFVAFSKYDDYRIQERIRIENEKKKQIARQDSVDRARQDSLDIAHREQADKKRIEDLWANRSNPDGTGSGDEPGTFNLDNTRFEGSGSNHLDFFDKDGNKYHFIGRIRGYEVNGDAVVFGSEIVLTGNYGPGSLTLSKNGNSLFGKINVKYEENEAVNLTRSAPE